MFSKEDLIHKLELKPHPEGGYYKETYRSADYIPNDVLSNAFNSDRAVSTCIYFLLTSENFSAFHRINQDEIWHHYYGAAIKIHMISEDEEYTSVVVGKDFYNGEIPQYVVKAKTWFAAEIPAKDSFALVGCTVAPGFDFEDFQLPSRQFLTELFPEHQLVITRLTNG